LFVSEKYLFICLKMLVPIQEHGSVFGYYSEFSAHRKLQSD